MKRLKGMVAAFAVLLLGAFVLVPATNVGALDPANPLAEVCANETTPSDVCESQDDDANALIKTLVNVLLFVVGALSTVMIIVGGIFYVTSNGDAGRVAKAKNTIMYSIVGLVVAFIAFALVNWVVDIF